MVDQTPAEDEGLSLPQRTVRVNSGCPRGISLPPPSPSSWLEIRLFYVRVYPCAVDAVPPQVTLSYLRRDVGAVIEINSARVPSSDPTSLSLRRDRLDHDAAEVTYVSTDSVRIAEAVDFQICDDRGNLLLRGSLGRTEALLNNSSVSFDQHHSPDKNPNGWSMDCYSAASTGASAFVQSRLGIFPPSFEVYVAGCFATVPVILTQTVQLSGRRKAVRPGNLDSIPEDEETSGHQELVLRRASSSVSRVVRIPIPRSSISSVRLFLVE
ncbi:hypothetical protein ZIOFF_001973 [Zingiber officinale]|uniref:Uncharacterized protein n=1 Tax=Zingiber officinale TaxID=94328 RepID=A0A8J5M950_ZINOF|nr:hypothetical protein ZIOFF_001973 [Zingiber officinale]